MNDSSFKNTQIHAQTPQGGRIEAGTGKGPVERYPERIQGGIVKRNKPDSSHLLVVVGCGPFVRPWSAVNSPVLASLFHPRRSGKKEPRSILRAGDCKPAYTPAV